MSVFYFQSKILCFVLCWTGLVTTQQRWELRKCKGYTHPFSPWGQDPAQDKTLCLSKAGVFSRELEMPEWLWCSAVFINALGGALLHATHLCPSFPPPKQTATQLLSQQIPHCVMLWQLLLHAGSFQCEDCFWGVTSCTIRRGIYFKENRGTCETVGKKSMYVLVLTACLKSLTLQRFLATIAILSLWKSNRFCR